MSRTLQIREMAQMKVRFTWQLSTVEVVSEVDALKN